MGNHELLKTAISFPGHKLWNLLKNKVLVSQEIEMNLNVLVD
jgi:hypothetical protein